VKKHLTTLCLAFTLLSVGNSWAVDRNGNGISDVYEEAFSFDRFIHSAYEDLDGDSTSAIAESAFGTDFKDNTDRPSMEGPFIDSGEIVFQFQTNPEVVYQPQTTTDLGVAFGAEGGTVVGDGNILEDRFLLSSGPTLFYRVTALPGVDTDGDGLTDYEESLYGSDKTVANSDTDAITDLQDFLIGTDPTLEFTFGGVRDGEGDGDLDGFIDIAELNAETDPLNRFEVPFYAGVGDFDFDGLPDDWEISEFGNISAQTGAGNPDGDLLTNYEEWRLGTDPNVVKTGTNEDGLGDMDSDSVLDIWELEDGTNPRDPASVDYQTNFVIGIARLFRSSTWGPAGQSAQYQGTKMTNIPVGYDDANPNAFGLDDEVNHGDATRVPDIHGFYLADQLIRIRRGVEYEVEMSTTNNNLPFLSGKYFWSTSAANNDDVDDKFIMYEVEGRQWYGTNTSSVPGALDPDIDPDPDVHGTHFTLKAPSGAAGPDTTTYPTGRMFMPKIMTPNPLPVTGVPRAKLTFEFDLPLDVSGITVEIGGEMVTNLARDASDPKVLYFTPPDSPTDTDGRFDLVIDAGDTISEMPADPWTLVKFVKYTTDGYQGMASFSKSNIVLLEEAISEAEDQGGSDDQKLNLIANIQSTWSNYALEQIEDFIDGRIPEEDVENGMATLIEEARAFASTKIAGYSLGQTSAPATGVVITPMNVEAWEQGELPAAFAISRLVPDPAPLTIFFSISGSATNGTDYGNISGSATIPANASSVEVEVLPIADANDSEGDETVIATLLPDPSYLIGDLDQATVVLKDGPSASISSLSVAPLSSPSRPSLGQSNFFPAVRNYLDTAGVKRIYYQHLPPTPGYPTGETGTGIVFCMVFDADAYELVAQDNTTVGTVIDDIVALHPGADAIFNGALCGYKTTNIGSNPPDAEPTQSIGIIINDSVVQPSSTNPSKGSYLGLAIKRYWFGQSVAKGASANMGQALSWQFGRAHPPIPGSPPAPTELDAAIGGLISLIWQTRDGRSWVQTYEHDGDLQTYDPSSSMKASFKFTQRIGFNFIGVDRDTNLLIVGSKQNFQSHSLLLVQQALFASGVDQALVTDGGASVGAFYRELGPGGLYIRSGRQNPNDRPDANNTVTSYFVFKPLP
jgi:hypothetical protein